VTAPPATSHNGRTDVLASAGIVWAAALFGTSFVVVKAGLGSVEPVPYLMLRFLSAGIALALLSRGRPSAGRGEWRLGLEAGASYLVGMLCQTIGLQYIDASASAFLTYLLAVAVPIILFVTRGRRPARLEVVALVVAVVGLALLTGGGVGIGVGQVLTLVGAVAFAVHLIQVGDAAGRGYDLFRFSAIQSFVVALVLAPLVPFTGGLPTSAAGWGVSLYAGLFVTVGAFIPWMWAARHIPPTRTALIFLLEPVFAALAGYLTGERLAPVAAAGALLILGGAALAVLAPRPGLHDEAFP
jgi:drug/metabolite transporter (DMT)-like permease